MKINDINDINYMEELGRKLEDSVGKAPQREVQQTAEQIAAEWEARTGIHPDLPNGRYSSRYYRLLTEVLVDPSSKFGANYHPPLTTSNFPDLDDGSEPLQPEREEIVPSQISKEERDAFSERAEKITVAMKMEDWDTLRALGVIGNGEALPENKLELELTDLSYEDHLGLDK